jgi:hypothetical protein
VPPPADDWGRRLRRLWQPQRALFWLFLVFNAMSSVCAWALRALPLTTAGLLAVGCVGLLNAGFGLWAAWVLMQPPPQDGAAAGRAPPRR